ncbi:MAG: N-acetylmuramoyl-L-alanine amidase [Phycisphaerae bacterium]|nr:N-acetylmuramoyl-L-alanine amidase [Phycisphaerae bacterium]
MERHITTLFAPKPLTGGSCLRFGLLLFLVAATGCHSQPKVILTDLPRDSAIGTFATPAPVNTTEVKPPPKHNDMVVVNVPAGWVPAVNERPWRWIVLHHSATHGGSAAIFDHAHRKRGWDELGYHFVITNGRNGPDGQVQIGSRWPKQKWGAHCGKTPGNAYNNYGIGICLVGHYSKKLPSARQLASLKKLLLFLMDRYKITPARVIGHRDAPNTATKCPGETLHRYINNVLRPELAR